MSKLPMSQVSVRTALRDMIVVLLTQTYLIVLVASGHLDYVQASVGIAPAARTQYHAWCAPARRLSLQARGTRPPRVT